jgi:hypothetical protein
MEQRTTLGEAVERHLHDEGFPPDGGLSARWGVARVGPVPICVPNTAVRRKAIPYHDANHVISGYSHDAIGEAEIAAWELGSGCKGYVASWVLNWASLVPGLTKAPNRLYRAFVRGRHTRNLYGIDLKLVRDAHVEEVRRMCGLEDPERPATVADTVLFLAVAVLSPLVGLVPVAISVATSPLWYREGAHRQRRIASDGVTL